jgi:general L-amino acid transport system substrate-binding protein
MRNGSIASSTRWGNYGESFERNLGPKTPLQLPRGANNLWTKGGLMYAPPIR